ncbi:MAG: carboxypeptidase-like regulatory domain-containing protein [Gemmatimonadota bacterium]|nr:carboxypeptidase-like regulatory domain-containing protein [Gemmatimonadota bacterium]
MLSRSPVAPVLAALLVLGAATHAHAQAMRVRVTEETTGRPLAGSLVDVLDTKDAVAVQGVLSSEGTRQLMLPGPGTYRVRLRRIGYQPFVGAPVNVAAGSTVDVTLLAPDHRVVLTGIRVLGRRCSNDAFDDPGLSTLWDEVRTLLTTTLLSRTDSTNTLEVRAFHRTLNANRDVTEEIVGLPRVTRSQRPYGARSAAALSREGYARVTPEESEYFGPDEQVLLSDEFLADHCFEVMRGTDATAGLLGVHFTPSDRRKVADISGTLWVDSASAALRYLDFWYEQDGLPNAAHGQDRSGGQVVFVRTPIGMWIVGAWRLRLPRLTKRLVGRGSGATATTGVSGYEEVGGVLRSGINDTVPPAPVLIPYLDLLAPARITGSVYDSLSDRPLAGARVWLVPSEPKAIVDMGLAPTGGRVAVTAASSTSDATGRFSFDGVPAGPYRLVFEHPSLDSLGVAIPRYDILLKPGARVIADVGSPSHRTLWDGCTRAAESASSGGDGLVLGTVRAAGDQRPLAGALVRASWVALSASVVGATRTYTVETKTTADGGYRLCGVPDSTFALVQAAGPHSSTGRVQAKVGSLGIAHVDLRLAETGEGEAPLAPGVVAGVVTDSIQQPMSNVQLAFDGLTVAGRSDDAGRFRLTDVMPGTQTLEVRRVGLDAVRRVVDVVPGATTTLSLTLTKTQLLEAMIVTAQRNRNTAELNDALRRHRAGSGTILLEEEIAKRSSVQSLLQGLSGVRVVQVQGSTPWVAMMRKGATECVARLFVDGHENDYDFLTTMNLDQIAIVEVFVHGALAPIFTAGRSIFGRDEQCGVLLFWLKH